MVLLDIDYVFTNISLDETINTCIDLMFNQGNIDFGLNKKQMLEIHSIALKKSIILFDNKYYCQVYGVAKGPTFSPVVANIFLFHHKST